MAAFLWSLVLEDLEKRALRQERRILNRYSAFDLGDELFVRNFRLSKGAARQLIEELRPHLTENRRLPTEIKVLAALRFYASGSYQRSIANDIFLAISQASVSRCIVEVSSAINVHLMDNWIRFPTAVEQPAVKVRFHQKFGIPGVLGAIDCTHVHIIAPVDDPPRFRESQYVNRKGCHSINVQLICDADMCIIGINAKYPGSVHDSFIWRFSNLREYFVNCHMRGDSSGWLLGDSGYALETWLLTPYDNPDVGSQQEIFNNKHARARNVIERCNSVLKNRFRYLMKHRVLHYMATVASKIINACAVLHNVCLYLHVPEVDIAVHDDSDAPLPQQQEIVALELRCEAQRVRDRVADSLQ